MNDVLFLLNPYANDGNASHSWKKAREKYSQLPKDPVDITKIDNIASYLEQSSAHIVAVVGGDGTINTVGNAIIQLKKKPTLAIVPMGFGNALAYCLGVENIEKAMRVINERKHTITIDGMKTNIQNHAVGFFNVSAGFDARIVYNRATYRYINARSYFISAIRSIVLHRDTAMTFTIDHTVTMRATASSLVVANCPIIGLNYVISSPAKLNDGLLDCTLFSTKYAYLRNLRLRGFKHPLYSEQGKVHFKASHIRIEGEPFVQIDGDPILQKGGIDITVAPAQVTFLRNEEKAIDLRYIPFIQ